MLAGPLLAKRAKEAGVVYALAYGDQPALSLRNGGLGRSLWFPRGLRGQRHQVSSRYPQSTPDTVWNYYGMTAEQAAAAGMNSQMFNSFLDGTKSAIEMAAISNATGLKAPADGLAFPPCGADELPKHMIPRAAGGVLEKIGLVEVGLQPQPRRLARRARLRRR